MESRGPQLSTEPARTSPLRSIDDVQLLLDDLRRTSQHPEDDVERVQNEEGDPANRRLRLLAALVDLVTRLENSQDHLEAAQKLADYLGDLFPGFTVYVGLVMGKRQECLLSGVSSQIVIDRQAIETELVEATFLEVIHRGEPGVWPPVGPSSHALLAHKQFANRVGSQSVFSVPLVEDQGKAIGAILFDATEPADSEEVARFVDAAAKPIARTLHLLSRLKRSRLSQVCSAACDFVSGRRGRWIALAVLVALSSLFMPVPYRIAADVELQPVERRFITAPFESRLASTVVKPGDVVESAQTLAVLDAREIQLELSAIEAELHQAEKEHAGYLARHESGPAEIARLEIERVRQRHALLTHRMEHLEIQSPIHGVVIAGDLSRSVGVPLQVGEALFEVAPLDEMLVEIAVPERDIRLVSEGTKVHYRLDAFPNRRQVGVIKRVHPKAELRENKNVFIAEVEWVDSEGGRPGMRGTAHLAGGKHALGWIVFHRAIYSIQVSLGW